MASEGSGAVQEVKRRCHCDGTGFFYNDPDLGPCSCQPPQAGASVQLGESPAFPTLRHQPFGDGRMEEGGLTKREHFAVQLFAAMITTSGAPALLGIGPGEDQMARAAVKLADVLLQELAK